MSGTKAGSIKARDTIYKVHGKDYFKRIGSIGGKSCNPLKGFGSNKQRAIEAGQKGGLKSSRKGIMNGYGKKPKCEPNDIQKYAEIYG